LLRACAPAQAKDSSRDLLLLDIALDDFLRLSLERVDMAALGRDAQLDLAALVLRNAAICVDDEEINQCRALWERLRGDSVGSCCLAALADLT
jgi:alpha-glucan,water dikinase